MDVYVSQYKTETCTKPMELLPSNDSDDDWISVSMNEQQEQEDHRISIASSLKRSSMYSQYSPILEKATTVQIRNNEQDNNNNNNNIRYQNNNNNNNNNISNMVGNISSNSSTTALSLSKLRASTGELNNLLKDLRTLRRNTSIRQEQLKSPPFDESDIRRSSISSSRSIKDTAPADKIKENKKRNKDSMDSPIVAFPTQPIPSTITVPISSPTWPRFDESSSIDSNLTTTWRSSSEKQRLNKDKPINAARQTLASHARSYSLPVRFSTHITTSPPAPSLSPFQYSVVNQLHKVEQGKQVEEETKVKKAEEGKDFNEDNIEGLITDLDTYRLQLNELNKSEKDRSIRSTKRSSTIAAETFGSSSF